jgi:hypothetical protein
MPSTAGKALMTATESFDLAFMEKADDDAIESYVADLPAHRVVETLHLISTLRRALSTAEKMATSRIDVEHILTTGEVWAAPDGHEFMWTGDRRRECTDPHALRTMLSSLELPALAQRALKSAFKTEIKTYLTELDNIVRFAPETEDLVREFTTWKEGPKKLRPLDGGR